MNSHLFNLFDNLLHGKELIPEKKIRSHMVERNCEICGDKFITNKTNLAKGWGRTCGRTCARKLPRRNK